MDEFLNFLYAPNSSTIKFTQLVERIIVRFTAKGNYEIQADNSQSVQLVIFVDEKEMELLSIYCSLKM